MSRGLRVIIIFEGRDAAGKGGTIRAITERVNSRVFRIAALPAPSQREKTQLFVQRYVQRFPAAGEIVIFDRSWYSQAAVDRVMNFASKKNYEYFLSRCSQYEQAIVNEGIILIKIWLEVSKDEQERRFLARINDPLRQWKLSPMDLEGYKYWDDISKVLETILKATDSKHAPWYILHSDDKRRARLNCISHILSLIPKKRFIGKRQTCPGEPKETNIPTCPRSAGGILSPNGTDRRASRLVVFLQATPAEVLIAINGDAGTSRSSHKSQVFLNPPALLIQVKVMASKPFRIRKSE